MDVGKELLINPFIIKKVKNKPLELNKTNTEISLTLWREFDRLANSFRKLRK